MIVHSPCAYGTYLRPSLHKLIPRGTVIAIDVQLSEEEEKEEEEELEEEEEVEEEELTAMDLQLEEA